VAAVWRKRWVRYAAFALSMPVAFFLGAAVYYYISFARIIDTQLHGEREKVLPRVLARPLELHRGQSLTERQLIDRLNDLGYAERAQPDKPGEFAVGTGAVAIVPRGPEFRGQPVRVVFQPPAAANVRAAARRPPPRKPADRVQRVELAGRPSDKLTLDSPLLTSLISG